jgi:ketosteroid isomerase-like protein
MRSLVTGGACRTAIDALRKARVLTGWLSSASCVLAVIGTLHGTVAIAQESAALEARVEALEAREAIRELIYAYGRALDRRDFIAFAGLFEPQSGMWVGGFGTATGRDEIFRMMDRSIGHQATPVAPTSHHVFTNIQIEVEGNTASATTKWIFVVPGESGAPQWRFLGHYEDEFVRTDEGWRFRRREAFTDIPIPSEPAADN